MNKRAGAASKAQDAGEAGWWAAPPRGRATMAAPQEAAARADQAWGLPRTI